VDTATAEPHPYRAARAVLGELHRIYLRQQNLAWSVSVAKDGQENFKHLGLTEKEAWNALRLLVTRGLAKFMGTQAFVITEEGIRACDHDLLNGVLPVPGEPGIPSAIDVEGGFAVSDVEIELAFLRDDDLRTMLARDIVELRQALDAGMVKAAMLLCGSILEAALLDVVGRRPDLAAAYRPKKRYPDAFGLTEFVEIAVGERLVPESVGGMASCVIDHRDLIHPAAELRRHTRLDSARAGAMAAFLRVIIHDLAVADSNGTLAGYEKK